MLTNKNTNKGLKAMLLINPFPLRKFTLTLKTKTLKYVYIYIDRDKEIKKRNSKENENTKIRKPRKK